MKLIAEKVIDEYRCVVPNLGVLSFSELPTEEGWVCLYREEGAETTFIESNFSKGYINDKEYYLCSAQNMIAFMQYIDEYALQYELFFDLERCRIENMHYWFCLAWECAESHYDDLPDWCQSIMDLYISKGYMFRVIIVTDQYEDDVFIFDKANLNHCKEDIENILRNALNECLEWRKEELEE